MEETKENEKPLAVLELEKIYDIVFSEIDDLMYDDEVIFIDNYYSINEIGEITGLCIYNVNLENLEPISKIHTLQLINFTICNIRNINELTLLENLQYLFLRENKIKDINPILKLSHLTHLGLSGNLITDFAALESLQNLKALYCWRTGIHDILFISKMPYLTNLNLSSNKIRDISSLTDLNNLNFIDLANNSIRTIPEKIAIKFNWLDGAVGNMPFYSGKEEKDIDLSNNPLEFPPNSVIELGPDTVQNYYAASDNFGHQPISEGRIIFVGDGSSGKSSIIEKMLYNSFALGREQTNGIKIDNLYLEHLEDHRKLTFHIWDFGGQEIQHAVHKFFFTEGCLYVLVLDNRKEEDPEYWLQQIQSLGGGAPVLVVFNKQDENAAETSDRKLLKEKYPNIVGFHNTSCLSGYGIEQLKSDLQNEAIQLRTVNEQFPNNWLAIKKAIEEYTSGSQHYLTYEVYREICKQNNTENEDAQKLLLKYFNTIGAVTWFGDDTHLKFLHVLNPAWITQGVYKILTAKKTANLFGQISIKDFTELLQPTSKGDYTYEEKHYAFILTMMKKFDLCYTSDDIHLLIPSAFGKVPKVEYSDFKGENIRTYILQFKDYMPLALIHRYITKNLPQAMDNNYWYTGIVINDTKSSSIAMIHADKEAKRIYIRVKDGNPLGVWEHFRREFQQITTSYARIPYDELVAVDENLENNVNYDDLVSHLQAKKDTYFHSKLRKDFYVGYLMGLFETRDVTLEKIKTREIQVGEGEIRKAGAPPPYVINILNNISPIVSTQVNTSINIDIDIQLVNQTGSQLKGDASFLLEELGESDRTLREALLKIVEFANDAKCAKNSGDVKEKGWGRKLKSILQTLGNAGEVLRHIKDDGEVIHDIFKGVQDLAGQFNMHDIAELAKTIHNTIV